jgi:hypothetical protein
MWASRRDKTSALEECRPLPIKKDQIHLRDGILGQSFLAVRATRAVALNILANYLSVSK